MTTEANGNTRPAAIITEKFRVKVGETTVTMGISPKTGTLCVYSWEDATGYHSLGRFPQAKYASQWKAMAAVIPAVIGYITKDEQSASPKLAYKAPGKSITTGETVEIDTTDSLVQMLVAQGMSREQAETLASAAE